MKAPKSSKQNGRSKMRAAMPRDKSPGLTDQGGAKSPSVSGEGDRQNTLSEAASSLYAHAYLEHLFKEKRDQPQVRQFGTKFMKFFGASLKAETPSEETQAMIRDLEILFQKALQSLPEQEKEELDAKARATVIRQIEAARSRANRGCPPG